MFILCSFRSLWPRCFIAVCCCCCCSFAVDRNQQNRYGRVFGDGPLVRIIGGIMCIAFCISREPRGSAAHSRGATLNRSMRGQQCNRTRPYGCNIGLSALVNRSFSFVCLHAVLQESLISFVWRLFINGQPMPELCTLHLPFGIAQSIRMTIKIVSCTFFAIRVICAIVRVNMWMVFFFSLLAMLLWDCLVRCD